MPTDAEADEIHLRVPTQPPMPSVVTVAVRVLGGRAGLAEADIEAARHAAADAYTELVEGGDPGPVDVLVHVHPGRLHIDLTGPTGARSITAER